MNTLRNNLKTTTAAIAMFAVIMFVVLIFVPNPNQSKEFVALLIGVVATAIAIVFMLIGVLVRYPE